MAPQPIEISFAHPRTNSIFYAEVGSATTGKMCIEGLLKHGFLEPLALHLYYRLARHDGRHVPLDAAVASIGILSDELLIIEVYDAANQGSGGTVLSGR